LRHARGIFENAVGQRAVTGEQHEARRGIIEPPDRKYPRQPFEQVAQGGTALWVGHGGDHMGRLIQYVIAGLQGHDGKLARRFHAVALGIGFRAKLADDNPIDAHLSAANQFLGVATGCDSGARDYFL
jgi:hypothetical protein